MPTIKVTYKDRGKGVATVHVPEAEFLILQTISTEKMTAPQITRKPASTISLNGVYTLLKRLERRGLIEREEGSLEAL
jgi:DNA-binding PadR family transcriptional regulator